MARKEVIGKRDGDTPYRVRWRVRAPDGSSRDGEKQVTGTDKAESLRREMACKYERKLAAPVSQATLTDLGPTWLKRYARIPRKSTKRRPELTGACERGRGTRHSRDATLRDLDVGQGRCDRAVRDARRRLVGPRDGRRALRAPVALGRDPTGGPDEQARPVGDGLDEGQL